MINIKSEREIELLKEAGRLTYLTHKEVEKHIKPGVTTLELDRIAEKFILSKGCTPSFTNSICSYFTPYCFNELYLDFLLILLLFVVCHMVLL